MLLHRRVCCSAQACLLLCEAARVFGTGSAEDVDLGVVVEKGRRQNGDEQLKWEVSK